MLRELRVCLGLECGSTKGRHFLAKKKNLTFKLSKGDQVRGAGTVLLFCVVKWYEMYEKLDVYNLPYHVIFMFLEFSRNRLVGDEPPPGDSSFSGLFWCSRDGTAWRQGLRRQATRDCTPSFLGF